MNSKQRRQEKRKFPYTVDTREPYSISLWLMENMKPDHDGDRWVRTWGSSVVRFREEKDAVIFALTVL
jgi:hypothetical protein